MAQKRLFRTDQPVDLVALLSADTNEEAAEIVVEAFSKAMGDTASRMAEAGFRADTDHAPTLVLTFETSGVK